MTVADKKTTAAKTRAAVKNPLVMKTTAAKSHSAVKNPLVMKTTAAKLGEKTSADYVSTSPSCSPQDDGMSSWDAHMENTLAIGKRAQESCKDLTDRGHDMAYDEFYRMENRIDQIKRDFCEGIDEMDMTEAQQEASKDAFCNSVDAARDSFCK
jgi:hypothetical protein